MGAKRKTGAESWNRLSQRIVRCAKCPRLRNHCREIARTKRAAFRDWTYWGKPVPNFGDCGAALLAVGLAPAAHGANRTGRMFTGDRSGDFLYRALFETGLASGPASIRQDDGLRLINLAITAVAHCAPPANKLTGTERANCAPYLDESLSLMPNLRGCIALGRVAFDALVAIYRKRGWLGEPPRPKFSHGALFESRGAPFLICSFHPSQQNTFTGRLTFEMLTQVLGRAARLANAGSSDRRNTTD